MLLKKPFDFLTGDYTRFSLESRIFHSFCIVAIVTLTYCVFLNFYLKLPISAWLSLAAVLIQSSLYYLSRFLNKTRLSIVLSIVIIHLVLITNYIYNSGMGGPTLLLLLAVFFIITAVAKPGSYKYWITLNVLIALGLIALEFFYPNVIRNMYKTRLTQFGDMATSYCLCSLAILIGLRYMKKNYYDAQDQLTAKADDLESINQTKNKMFSIISHDLKAPIATIQSYLEVLSEMDINHRDGKKIKGDLMLMTQNTDMMLSNLLMWSKSQMEGIKLDKKLLNLEELISPIIAVFKPIANRKEVNLSYSVEPDLQVFGDKNMLELVIRNILSNAIKFTHPNGKVELMARYENSACLIIIKDTGVGMTEHMKSNVFSLKGESSYGTNNEKGVGLGLSLSKEFVDLQNGTLRCESELGKGTTFYISMPS